LIWIKFVQRRIAYSGAREGGTVQRIILLSIAAAAALTGAFATVATAQDAGKNTAPAPDFQAKAQYCRTCHGLSGQGFHGAIPIPRLAGQQPEYFENQLGAFLERRRESRFMFGVVHALTPQMISALSAYFHDLEAKPLGGAPKDLVSTGKKIYEEGSGSDVPACGSCHGADARGNGPFPRLAGQLHDYTFNKLVNWSKERGQDPAKPDTSALMEPIAHGLSQQQVRAVAAYLNYLE
jgi:cytochrome c553